jgi:hypothetical protein
MHSYERKQIKKIINRVFEKKCDKKRLTLFLINNSEGSKRRITDTIIDYLWIAQTRNKLNYSTGICLKRKTKYTVAFMYPEEHAQW